LEEGVAVVGDEIDLAERPLPDWSVKRTFGILIGGDHKRAPDALPVLRDMAVLDSSWRRRAADLMAGAS
jgi:MOSC domain-containing protein YiiM